MPAGRPKGSLNEKTKLLVPITEQLKKYKFDVVKELLNLYDEIQRPEDRANILLKLMDFVYPKKRSIEVSERPSKEMLAEWVREYLEESNGPTIPALPRDVSGNPTN